MLVLFWGVTGGLNPGEQRRLLAPGGTPVGRHSASAQGQGYGARARLGRRARARPSPFYGARARPDVVGAGLPAWHAMAMAPGSDGLRRAWLPGRSGPSRA
jgi:hypothetical protein